jgi:hypothetical protein
MTTTHTPGPWHVVRDDGGESCWLIRYADPDGLASHVARLYPGALCPEHGTVEANARLIAAAPDLLAALDAWYTWYVEQPAFQDGEDPMPMQTFCAARAALAKAKA